MSLELMGTWIRLFRRGSSWQRTLSAVISFDAFNLWASKRESELRLNRIGTQKPCPLNLWGHGFVIYNTVVAGVKHTVLVGSRGVAGCEAELAGKVAGTGKRVLDGDIGNRFIGGCQHPRGGLDALLHAVFHGTAMQIPSEEPLTDPWADVRHASEVFDANIAFQMRIDPFQHGFHALLLQQIGTIRRDAFVRSHQKQNTG